VQSLAFTGGLVQRFPWIRDRMIADDKFLFKVVAEVLIDSGGQGIQGSKRLWPRHCCLAARVCCAWWLTDDECRQAL
jgi:hypothetical protein